jgi:hypothetical protein
MFSLVFFLLALLFTMIHLSVKKEWSFPKIGEIFLCYLLLFSVGLESLVSGLGHIFMGPEIARQIGWAPGSPFQFEVGVANLSYGVLGVLSFWISHRFREATILGWSLFLLGAFVGHLMQENLTGDRSSYNFGFFIWFYDLFLPLFMMSLLFYVKRYQRVSTK